MNILDKLLILRTPGVGPVKYAKIIESGIQLNHTDEHIDAVRREMARAAELDVHYICTDSEYYPPFLKQIKNHPPVITARGNLDVLKKPAVAMVGTRHATAAGMRFISDMAREFAGRGTPVVSGMAMGVDTAAHTGALLSDSDACTIAVLAGGVDSIWPLENESLYKKIIERGCVVSEMPPGTKPNANLFIQRNRWIAGIAEKLILGEADEKSGSTRTAQFALDYGRAVFAVPSHPSDERSRGPNRLIQDGRAKLCMGAEDFFGEKEKRSKNKIQNPSCENEIFSLVSNIPMTDSVLAELVKKPVGEVRRELVMLELSGLVVKSDNGYVKA